MLMTFVNSSAIAFVGYDLEKSLLRVEFRSGAVYDYFGVWVTECEKLMNAKFPETYLKYHIRNRYPSAQAA